MRGRNLCKGCSSLICDLPPKTDEHQCPCVECLVKMICDDVCDEYLKYERYV
jgi:hypothetical protein